MCSSTVELQFSKLMVQVQFLLHAQANPLIEMSGVSCIVGIMGKKKKSAEVGPRPNDAWEYITEMQINGRNVIKGTELKIAGERGRFRFVNYTRTDKGKEWITVWGGPKGMECMRSFDLERVKTVHTKNTTDANLVKELKAKKKAAKAEKQASQSQ